MWLENLRRRWTADALAHVGRCPRCGGERVWRNGVRLRKATVLDGERAVYVEDVPVRRLRCGCCKARWSRAPEHVESRAHYQPAVVAHAVVRVVVDGGPTAVAREIGCDRSTLGRWVERVAKVAEPARLSRVLLAAAGQPVLPAPPTARTSRSARCTALGARALAVLALLEALASLQGLPPPGLAHADLLVPADAAPAASTVILGGGSVMV
jgi:transposase-like protein